MQLNIHRLEQDIQTYMDLMSSKNKTITVSDVVGLRHRIMRRFNKRHSNNAPLPLDALGVIATEGDNSKIFYHVVGDTDVMGLSDTYHGRKWVAAYTMDNIYKHIVASLPLENIKQELEQTHYLGDEKPGDQLFDDVPSVPDSTPTAAVKTQRDLVWRLALGLLDDSDGGEQFPSKCILRPPSSQEAIFPIYVSCVQNGLTVRSVFEGDDAFMLLEPYGVATVTYFENCATVAEGETRITKKEVPASVIVNPMETMGVPRLFTNFAIDKYDDLSFDIFLGNLEGDVDIVAVPKAVMSTDSLTWDRLPKIDPDNLFLNVNRLLDFEWEDGEVMDDLSHSSETGPSNSWWLFAIHNGVALCKPAVLTVTVDDNDVRLVDVDGRRLLPKLSVGKTTSGVLSVVDLADGKVDGGGVITVRRLSDNRRFTVSRIINPPAHIGQSRVNDIMRRKVYVRDVGTFESVEAAVAAGHPEEMCVPARTYIDENTSVGFLSKMVIQSATYNQDETAVTVVYTVSGTDVSQIASHPSAVDSVVVMKSVADKNGNGGDRTNCALLSEFFDTYVVVG